jgi:hypothetical protein
VGQYLNMMIESSKRCYGYAEKLMAGIRPEQAARKPHFETSGALKVVDTNHPTFCFGHLALYPEKILSLVGVDPSSVATPANWTELFSAGKPCQDDTEGKIYPPFAEVSAAFLKHMNTVYAELAKVDDAVLNTPTNHERYRAFLPVTGMAVNFMLNAHIMMHAGQVSAWRRCFDMPGVL